ncbi:MAG: discoidin domain-containing protein [Tannerella sp.]|jgi:alpha-mannosidase|nr:discoidin domain-containing protein [Tannerella sp.]
MKPFRKLGLVSLLLGAPLLMSAQQQQTGKPKVYVVSNAHFDTQWGWDVQTSIRENLWNTIEQNLFLMSKYPDYIFNFEGAIKYAWMKEYYPLEYAKVKQYVKEGRWHPAGAMWDATDINIPSPESDTRNILYGQEFYEDEFGMRDNDIFLPDCFGFGWTLPTVAAHCGLIGFSTQKLQWRYKPFYKNGLKIPFNFGLWQGVDGSRIMLIADAGNYTTHWPDEDLSCDTSLIKEVNANPEKRLYHYYGTGDTGGSPTLESVIAMEKGLKGKGPIQIISANSGQFYQDYLPFNKHPELPVFNGELLLDVHGTGCYTSQSAMKLFNRKNEQLGTAAERSAVVADWLGGQTYPMQTISDAYRRFIWHQFHDDLTGNCIPRAYEFSWDDELLSQKQFAQVLRNSVGTVARALNTQVKGIPIVINNPVADEVSEVLQATVSLPASYKEVTVYNEQGKPVPTQILSRKGKEATIAFAAKLPSLSYVVYDLRSGKAKIASALKVGKRSIENAVYKIQLNDNGDITSIFDKRANRELVEPGKVVRLAVFNDVSKTWPSWEVLKSTIDETPKSITDDVQISVAENGPARAALKVVKKFGASTFCQYIRLTQGGQDDRIDFVNDVDWASPHTLLKAEFPLSVSNEKATYDLGLGNIQRGTNTDIAYEVIAQDWADLSDQSGSYGVSVLDDSKYGWDKPDSHTIRLSLLRTPGVGRNYTYEANQDFGHHQFSYSIVGHTGALKPEQAVLESNILNQPAKTFTAPKHKGALGRSFSFLKLGSDQIRLVALKRAERSNDYVLRFYETSGKPEKNMTVTFAGDIASAQELNGVEDVIGQAHASGKTLTFDIPAYAIKTFRVRLAAPPVELAQPASYPLSLPYNTKIATYTAFHRTGDIDGKGDSYAAELLPKEINQTGVRFEFPSPEVNDGLRCHGDTLDLPAGKHINKLYLLAASTSDDDLATVYVDGRPQTLIVPNFSGFIGEWGHQGQTKAFYKTPDVAYVGTHIHSVKEANVPYIYGYMFRLAVKLPKDAKEVVLPKDSKILVFAATAALDNNDDLTPAMPLVTTDMESNNYASTVISHRNLLVDGKLVGHSGEDSQRSKAAYAIDDNPQTFWVDATPTWPKFIEVDLGKAQTLRGWDVKMGRFGRRFAAYGPSYKLEVKTNASDAWQTVGEEKAAASEQLLAAPAKARYVRLEIEKPEQTTAASDNSPRRAMSFISDFEVF